MDGSIVIQQPAAATQLIILCHGVGSNAADLAPLGRFFAAHLPEAAVISAQAPDRSDFGQGFQWFSVAGISEASRPARVEAAMPAFMAMIDHWQKTTGVGADATTLVGFSQGSIMSLEASQTGKLAASRIIALSGRFASAPRNAATGIAIHLLHGTADPVIAVSQSTSAAEVLKTLAADVTLDVFNGLAHTVDQRVAEKALGYLSV